MASFRIEISPRDGSYTSIHYNTSYDPIKNETTLTFTDSVYVRTWTSGRTEATASITITVKATDSGASEFATAYTDDYRNTDSSGWGVTYPSPSKTTLTVKHSNTDGEKSVTISLKVYVTWDNGNGSNTNTGSTTVSSGTFTTYKLSTSAGTGSVITVDRILSEAQGATGNLSNGSDIYKNDVLKITFDAEPGYAIKTQTVNGSVFTSGDTHTVSDNVDVATTTELYGLMYIYNGSNWDPYLVYVDNGTSWDQYIPYVDNGSSWDICS